MGKHRSKQRRKHVRDTDASSPIISKEQRHGKSVELQLGECESESRHLLPSSDSVEKIDVPSASGAISDPSALYTSVIGNNYYVFLSFRGPDTRNGFVDHLYHRLKDVGLPFHPNFVFRDDEDLPFGQEIAANLLSAIERSKVSIPVISEKYAASEWCLRELIQIMEFEERGEQKVLPVLYKVKPYEVRELKGAFGEAFESRKDRFDEKVKQQGLVALRKALDLRVFESEKYANGHEAELIKELLRVITDEQQHDFLPPLPMNLVGIDDRVAEVMKLADTDPSEIRIIGIFGIGGIGKTTLATNIYNKLAKKFEWRSFLMDITETINRKGMEHIQSLLISDITKNHESRVRDSIMGIRKIRLCCEKKKEINENIEALCLDKRGSREFIKQESFKKMPNLKFLRVTDVDVDGDYEGSLTELRWLEWKGFHNSFEAIDFHLEKLVVLDLHGVSYERDKGVSENWRGWSSIKMERLKVLNLTDCCLRSIPNLSAFKNLEMLILKFCYKLEEIDPSIRDVKCLVSLNLDGCTSLKKLPEQLGELEKFEELVVSNTGIKEITHLGSLKKLKRISTGSRPGSSIVRIPPSIGKLGELLELDLSFTNIKELPESIGELNKLKILKIVHSVIERLPSSIGKLQTLQELLASISWKLEGQILFDKGGLSSLKTLDFSGTKISGLPENLHQLSSLEHLNLLGCEELESLPKPPCSLLSLRLACRSNELPSLSHLKHLQELLLWDCGSLQSIPELPSCIRNLNVARCPKLERLPNLSDLEFLSKLRLGGCDGLKKLDGLEALKSLREFCLHRSPPKDYIPHMEPELSNLDGFDEKPDDLYAIEGLEKLESLELVEISARKHIQVLDLSKSEHLKYLEVTDCKSLVEIRCPSKILEYFNGDGCKSLEKLPDSIIKLINNKKTTEDYVVYSDSTEEDYEESSDSTEEDYEEYILWRRIMKNIQILWRMTKICFGDR